MTKPNPFRKIAENAAQAASPKLRVSFKHIDWGTEGFFVHGGDEQFYQHLFSALNRITHYTEDEFKVNKPAELTPKFLNWDYEYITKQGFPNSKLGLDPEVCKESFEIRITKNLGRIHGFLFDSVFYVVWFDPCHNLLPGVEKNRLRKIRTATDYVKVKCLSPDEINRLTARIEELECENRDYVALLESQTSS